MNTTTTAPERPRAGRRARRTHETILVLQGGGALGAYQAGAFEAMAEHDRVPDWVAGISIGAINSALIAGNPPERRVERLRAFWTLVSAGVPWTPPTPSVALARAWVNDWSAAWGATFGLPGFFTPRLGAALWPGELPSPSFYDTQPLRDTLLELVDFDYLNDGPVRVSVGAVNVQTGNFVYFDNRRTRLGPEHVMASGALPPGFPAVRVDDADYWDGGLVSNTPLRHVIDTIDADAATILQVDLFSARGTVPGTLDQVQGRDKDIRYSSRTRAVTDMLRERHEMHRRIRQLAGMLPDDRRDDPLVRKALAETRDTAITLVHLIRSHENGETQAKDYEFSRASTDGRWQSGHDAMLHSLHRLDAEPDERTPGAFRVFDFGRPEGDTTQGVHHDSR
ncbi:MAG: patatin-like phospholipase family protein [Betaproteobacteria bacterium]|nr:patatin-like phospholipase family protein [Betaproteobacteria bacterium]